MDDKCKKIQEQEVKEINGNGYGRILWWLIGVLFAGFSALSIITINSIQTHLTQIDNILAIRSERIAILDTNQKSVFIRLDKIDSNSENIKEVIFDIKKLIAIQSELDMRKK